MGGVLDGDSAIDMGIDDAKRTDVFGVKLFGCLFVVHDEAFIAWLIAVVMAFFVCSSKVVINDDMLTFLEDVKICNERYVEEHVAVKNNVIRCHAQSSMNGCTSCM
jgi:hypothetical protein